MSKKMASEVTVIKPLLPAPFYYIHILKIQLPITDLWKVTYSRQ